MEEEDSYYPLTTNSKGENNNFLSVGGFASYGCGGGGAADAASDAPRSIAAAESEMSIFENDMAQTPSEKILCVIKKIRN